MEPDLPGEAAQVLAGVPAGWGATAPEPDPAERVYALIVVPKYPIR